VRFTLERGARYRGIVTLSRFQRALASPDLIRRRLSEAGVRVLVLRPVPEGFEVQGCYSGPSGTVELPSQVTSIERQGAVENLDHLEPSKVRGGNSRPRKPIRVRRSRRKVLD
jgi:hypothetical protein